MEFCVEMSKEFIHKSYLFAISKQNLIKVLFIFQKPDFRRDYPAAFAASKYLNLEII